jgi:hypothetical protein
LHTQQQTHLITRRDILDTLTRHTERLQQMGVRSLGLFGSYGRGTAAPDSDMDFLVLLERSSFDDYMELKFFLEDLFGCSIDLVMEQAIKPRLRPTILAEVVYVPGLSPVPGRYTRSNTTH